MYIQFFRADDYFLPMIIVPHMYGMIRFNTCSAYPEDDDRWFATLVVFAEPARATWNSDVKLAHLIRIELGYR